MKRISPIIALLAVAATLFHAGPQQAYACSCIGFIEDGWLADSLLTTDLALVVARVTSVERTPDEIRASLVTERTLSGTAARNIVVESRANDGCGQYAALGTDTWHFLVLNRQYGGMFLANGCTGFPMKDAHTATDQPQQRFLEALQRARFQLNDSGTSLLLVGAYVAGSLGALAAVVGFGERRPRA